MLHLVTASSLAADIRMMRAAVTSPVVAVEGPSDLDAYARLAPVACRYIAARGKRMVLDAIELAADVPAVAGIVDADFDGLLCQHIPSEGKIFSTDTTDLDSWLFFHGGGYRLIELLHPDLSSWSRRESDALLNQVVDAGVYAGAIRLLNAERSLGLNLNSVPWPHFFAASTGEFDVDSLFAFLRSRGRPVRSTFAWDGLRQDYDGVSDIFRGRAAPPQLICRGHDLVLFFSCAAKSRAWISGKQAEVPYLERLLRRIAVPVDVENTLLMGALAAWASKCASEPRLP